MQWNWGSIRKMFFKYIMGGREMKPAVGIVGVICPVAVCLARSENNSTVSRNTLPFHSSPDRKSEGVLISNSRYTGCPFGRSTKKSLLCVVFSPILWRLIINSSRYFAIVKRITTLLYVLKWHFTSMGLMY